MVELVLAEVGGGDQLPEAPLIFWKGVENSHMKLFFLTLLGAKARIYKKK